MSYRYILQEVETSVPLKVMDVSGIENFLVVWIVGETKVITSMIHIKDMFLFHTLK